jgi:hypothetical protein
LTVDLSSKNRGEAHKEAHVYFAEMKLTCFEMHGDIVAATCDFAMATCDITMATRGIALATRIRCHGNHRVRQTEILKEHAASEGRLPCHFGGTSQIAECFEYGNREFTSVLSDRVASES